MVKKKRKKNSARKKNLFSRRMLTARSPAEERKGKKSERKMINAAKLRAARRRHIEEFGRLPEGVKFLECKMCGEFAIRSDKWDEHEQSPKHRLGEKELVQSKKLRELAKPTRLKKKRSKAKVWIVGSGQSKLPGSHRNNF